jgi:hypothetical protein
MADVYRCMLVLKVAESRWPIAGRFWCVRARGAGAGADGRAGTSSRTCRPSGTPASPRSGSRTPGCASSRIRPRCRLRSSSRPGRGPCRWATGSPGSAPPFLRATLRARLLCSTTSQERGAWSPRKDRWSLGGRERVLICRPMLCRWIRLERGLTGLKRAALQLLAALRARIRRCLGRVRYSTWHDLYHASTALTQYADLMTGMLSSTT